ncbi:NAD-dependent epimerase/dehydratase family protein [Kandleria sp.]|uniref:NAD-dependent epimerase/dehydratase family protein n=1 Tax=Kandleria sp. TaxID=2774291 RepID=UPI001B42C2E9|nr:NAD-dependent epimerase/dehydratase family protein [Kandleria sp.]MBP3275462.1 NAD-dependent epimerase/dehydratase family protein [Kandleria sp.]
MKDKYFEDVELVIDSIKNINNLYYKSILITGASGMICSSVVEILLYLNEKRNANIKIFLAGRNKERMCNRFALYEEGEDFTFIQYDATKNDFKNDFKFDYIIHGASNANPNMYKTQPVETMLANVVGLNALLDFAVNNNVKRVLYISSSEVYGNKDELDPYDENDYGYLDILNDRASYPSSKRAAETLCVAYSNEYKIETVIVRPGHIYGPTILKSDNRASASFTRDVIEGRNILMKSAGSQLRSYCYTMDCASAILSVLLNGENKNAYNISNKNSIVTIREFAEMLASLTGNKIEFERPTDADVKSFNLMSNSSLTSQKIEEIGWEAKFDLETGCRHTIKLIKE